MFRIIGCMKGSGRVGHHKFRSRDFAKLMAWRFYDIIKKRGYELWVMNDELGVVSEVAGEIMSFVLLLFGCPKMSLIMTGTGMHQRPIAKG